MVTIRARTDLGKTRDHNEDAFLVADGMGGAAAGELASSMAADLIFRHLIEQWDHETDVSAESFARHLRGAVERANERIHIYSKEHPDVRGMGTTVTVAGVLQNNLYLAQVGDSRGYLVRNGVATQLTKDQSLMQRLVDAGELTEAEAEISERRNIILQALGPDARIRVDLTWQELQQGDTLVICSDGLSGQVKREEFGQLVQEVPDLDKLCARLIALANERGGPDNITVVTVRFEGENLAASGAGADVGYHAFLADERDSGDIPALTAEAPIPEVEREPVIPNTVEAPIPTPPAMRERSGSPATLATVGAGFLVLLLLLYLLLKR